MNYNLEDKEKLYSLEKSDLISLLTEFHRLLKEKERDLILASEIGESLLKNNVALKAKYEELLEEKISKDKQELQTSEDKKYKLSSLENLSKELLKQELIEVLEQDLQNFGDNFKKLFIQVEQELKTFKDDKVMEYKQELNKALEQVWKDYAKKLFSQDEQELQTSEDDKV
ncbi:19110_t:CDS:2 [Dentiscutata erythropus]|uniref:19110_t:CDS:1 n=1 Tax=Dentiscutata erythropus TaxID=1348616 RepID=A0A9N8ZEH8_9GLOM|nr:19110_t:CDS:2 [Dentiscutata erythropus]